MNSLEDHVKLLRYLITNLEDKQTVHYNPRLEHVLGLMKTELYSIVNFINDENNRWVFDDANDKI